MSQFVERCRVIIDNRGLGGFALFVLGRLARRSADLVFEIRTDALAGIVAADYPEGLALQRVDRDNLDDDSSQQVLAQALKGEDAIYGEELARDGCLFAVMAGSDMVHVSFVQFETSYKRILGEPAEAPLIGNCWTSPQARGQGLYPRTLRNACRYLHQSGYTRVVISCAPDNVASVAGIAKAGFEQVRAVSSLVILTRIAVQIIREQGRRKLVVRWLG